jgi:hypothetical protein
MVEASHSPFNNDGQKAAFQLNEAGKNAPPAICAIGGRVNQFGVYFAKCCWSGGRARRLYGTMHVSVQRQVKPTRCNAGAEAL